MNNINKLYYSAPFKCFPYSSTIDRKHLAYLVHIKTVMKHFNGLINIIFRVARFFHVHFGMFSTSHNYKVFKSIIAFVTIYVMDKFRFKKWSAYRLFHKNPMLLFPATKRTVSTFIMSVIIFIKTFDITKMLFFPLTTRGWPRKFNSTIITYFLMSKGIITSLFHVSLVPQHLVQSKDKIILLLEDR